MYGDRNTPYYHRLAKIKAMRHRMKNVNKEDGIITRCEEIEQHFLSNFQSIFYVKNQCVENGEVRETFRI